MQQRTGDTRMFSAAVWVALLSSSSTLLCCALPALLVALGAGAVLASLVHNFPALVWVSEHKPAVFGAAAVVLVAAGGLQWLARSLPCPLEPALAATCARTRVWSLRIYLLSLVLYTVGSYFAFIAGNF